MPHAPSRRSFLRQAAGIGALVATASPASWLRAATRSPRKSFDVRDYGAVGDGATLDTTAIQRTIDTAAASGADAQVLVPGGRKYLIGALTLRSGIEFYLADNAELRLSTDPAHFNGRAGHRILLTPSQPRM